MRFMMLVIAPLAIGAASAPDPAALAGDWVVDLSATPDQVYTKPMHLEIRADGTVAGDFYNSIIEAGRWKADRGRICVSFRTSDGAGPYHSSACRVGDIIQGQTWAEQRNFLFNWNAIRKPAG